MKRIAFIHEAYPLGGAEKVTSDVVRYLTAEGRFEAFLFVRKLHDAILSGQDRRNFHFIHLPDPDFQSRANAVFIADRISGLGIDYLVVPVFMLRELAYIREHTTCKIVFHHHGMPLWEVQNKMIVSERRAKRGGSFVKRLHWALFRKPKETVFRSYTRHYEKQYREIYRQVDCFAVLCDEYRRQVEAIVGAKPETSKVRVLTNPLRTDGRFNPDKRKEVLYVGRLGYADKRVDRLLRIWARIEKQFPEWTLKLVGDGPERDDLERMSAELGLRQVRFCGYAVDPQPHFDTAAILCLTSTFEGWGLVLAEAQAAGVVPMAFPCSGGVREIIGDDGTTGVCVPPFDELAYARELAALMRDGERRRAMQPAMRRKAAAYSPEHTGRMWLRLLEELDR